MPTSRASCCQAPRCWAPRCRACRCQAGQAAGCASLPPQPALPPTPGGLAVRGRLVEADPRRAVAAATAAWAAAAAAALAAAVCCHRPPPPTPGGLAARAVRGRPRAAAPPPAASCAATPAPCACCCFARHLARRGRCGACAPRLGPPPGWVQLCPRCRRLGRPAAAPACLKGSDCLLQFAIMWRCGGGGVGWVQRLA